jgi:hypothetical protein
MWMPGVEAFSGGSDDNKQQHKLAGTQDRRALRTSTAAIKCQPQICKAATAIPHNRAQSHNCEGHRDGVSATCAGLHASACTIRVLTFQLHHFSEMLALCDCVQGGTDRH